MGERVGAGESFPVRVDFERILETIASRIYDNQYAFLRENVQNAIDAVRIQAFRDGLSSSDSRYQIDVRIEGNTCSITDNGIGMTRVELINNYWTMGASGKTTAEARAAGCIGIFGIGGFANFGVCDSLEVISRTETCKSAHHTSLSRSSFKADRFDLPKVQYEETDELPTRGTVVRGTAGSTFDEAGLTKYLKEFVRHVPERINVQGQPISQVAMEAPRGSYREMSDIINQESSGMSVRFQLFADDAHNLTARVSGLKMGGEEYRCHAFARLVHGQLEVYKIGFRICSVNINSRIGVSGFFDCDILQPTAGRDSLDGRSHTLLSQIFKIIELSTLPLILADSDLLANHIRMIPSLVDEGHLEKLGLLSVNTIEGGSVTLGELREFAHRGKRVFYSHSGRRSSAAEVLEARGHVIVKVSANPQRRSAEMRYIRGFCRGEEFDNLIECVEVYTELDTFERAVLSELDVAIRKLFKPHAYRFTAGKLTLDAPIYWSDKKQDGAIVVFVDTRHGEFLKLKPLGYSSLFWSMIEAFCREYLGDTLKRQSPKFFGSGAIDLETYSKSHAELWELLSSDIEVSRITAPDRPPRVFQRVGRIEVVRTGDIERVTISHREGVTATQTAETKTTEGEVSDPAKLLQIVDETDMTGLEGYYLRIPESATIAFGELIRTFPSFVIIWFANRVTWQGSDLKSTAFLFDVTLDRLIGASDKGELAHGAVELGPSRVQTYKDQIYFYIVPSIQGQLIPISDEVPVKIEIRHELVDLGKPRSWTSRERKS